MEKCAGEWIGLYFLFELGFSEDSWIWKLPAGVMAMFADVQANQNDNLAVKNCSKSYGTR